MVVCSLQPSEGWGGSTSAALLSDIAWSAPHPNCCGSEGKQERGRQDKACWGSEINTLSWSGQIGCCVTRRTRPTCWSMINQGEAPYSTCNLERQGRIQPGSSIRLGGTERHGNQTKKAHTVHQELGAEPLHACDLFALGQPGSSQPRIGLR